MDVAQLTLVEIGHYSARQLADPQEVPASFALALLRAHAAKRSARAELDRQASSKS